MANKKQTNKKRFFYPDEFEKLCDKLKLRQRFMAICLINTGARINEVRGITLGDLDSNRKSIILRQTKIRSKRGEKTPEPRIIAVSDKFFRYLKENLPHIKFLTTNAFNLGIKYACKEVSIYNPEQFSAHKFRKTFGTWMLALGVDGFKLAQHLGHTPTELAKDYATNDVFSYQDKQIMRSILGNLPERF
jgi:integrase